MNKDSMMMQNGRLFKNSLAKHDVIYTSHMNVITTASHKGRTLNVRS